MVNSFWLEHAWSGRVEAEVESGVLLEVDDGAICAVTTGVTTPPPQVAVLRGFTVPGLANAHSHSFHRALRGRTEGRGDSPSTFWDWRDRMYAVAASTDPVQFHRLARATFAEMALAGITLVGEFHYLHHDIDGSVYSEPNVMGSAIAAAATDAGVRLTLLDACYLHGGLGPDGYLEPSPVQQRFADRDVDAWGERVSTIHPNNTMRVGAAVHSVRAVDPGSITAVARWATDMEAPFHTHLSEQPAENERCLAAHGITPTAVFSQCGAIGPLFTAVHGTHLGPTDLSLLGEGEASVCLCPTTERDLGDGIGDARAMVSAGASIAVGTDSQAIIDLLEEARSIELDQRLSTLQRGHHSPTALLGAASGGGYRSLGWPEGGTLTPGALADFTTLRTDTPRLAGQCVADLVTGAVFATTAADVENVVVAGETIVAEGRHLRIDVAAELQQALR